MKNSIFMVLILSLLLLLIGVATTNDLQFEELTTLKQLYNIQQEIIKDNIPEQELDSIYFEYKYHYINSYYEKNYK